MNIVLVPPKEGSDNTIEEDLELDRIEEKLAMEMRKIEARKCAMIFCAFYDFVFFYVFGDIFGSSRSMLI